MPDGVLRERKGLRGAFQNNVNPAAEPFYLKPEAKLQGHCLKTRHH